MCETVSIALECIEITNTFPSVTFASNLRTKLNKDEFED